LFFKRCGAFFGLGTTKREDSLVFLELFEGVCCFHFDVGSGFGPLFFNGFVGLNGNGFGAFGVLYLDGFGKAARFFSWRTRLDGSRVPRLTGRSLLRRPREAWILPCLEAVTWGQ
jgi:hypothetical protein